MPAGTWDSTAEADRVLVDHDRRFRRRIVLSTEAGRDVLVDLPQAVRMRDGDGLMLDGGGGVVRVCAKPEKLLEIHAHDDSEMVRIAWHLGNRHLPVQLLGDRIRIRDDYVIREMVEVKDRPQGLRPGFAAPNIQIPIEVEVLVATNAWNQLLFSANKPGKLGQ